VPIGVELDLHCHYTERMQRHADIIIAYKEYPHTDVADRFEEVWQLTLAAAQRSIKPVTAMHACRMAGFWHTTREPMKTFVQRMKDLEGHDGVLSVSFGHGFPYGDVPEADAKVWVITDNDPATAARVARMLGREIWELRDAVGARQTTVGAAVQRLRSHGPGKPLVLADIADNAGGGASSDSTFILRALIDAGIGNVALGGFYDLGAVQVCRDAGVGARLLLRVGGKLGPASGLPVDLAVQVRAFKHDHSQGLLGVGTQPCGPAAWVSTDDGIDLVLISQRVQVYGSDMFSGLGVDLPSKRGIVVKSSQHFHAAFAPLASEVLYVESPGLLRTDFENLDYRHRDPNYWPRVADPFAAAGG
jgi:microcystin degradation protein MlrC